MSGWTETLSLKPYNIKTGTVSIVEDGTSITVQLSPAYASDNYTVTITPKFVATVIPYVTDVTSTNFTINGEPGNYYWMTISIS